ncbi:shikimate dehydrogenase [Anseongella ginsenosidimutans]|uniref:Shikimate dehydrogenase n=1 Tax=Anseongella ginsenosidimutans TaxID=496056 RepID=A0A4R3KV94_9SPHI|nr:shikimate dehydrogenase [Anseongella ginsenosidimutans]QEC51521.1 shikimate dehydrogenase [Anseongella ginsenosidimutans]TCS88834.1 shikimate dehydrogenase [Anseongella ginsenosidimutans]
MKQLLGLIGYPLSHSFSKEYFRRKFEQEGISGYTYELFPLEKITSLPALLEQHPQLAGLNVTIPHKVAVLPYLQHLDETAAAIGAVNTIKISNGILSGYNTDAWGFSASLRPLLQPWHKKALILGTGGASKAVLHVLRSLGIDPLFVSRQPGNGQITYSQLDGAFIRDYPLIINTTPLGTFPDTESCPEILYNELSERNLLYDLVYNPAETLFLKKGKERGAAAINGMEMLRLQAEKAWEIWTKET